MFSFNSPIGACEKCKGIGTLYRVDPELILNKNLSVNEGGIIPFSKFFFAETWYVRLIRQVGKEENIDLNTPIKNLEKNAINIILYGTDKVRRVPGTNRFGNKTVIYERFTGIVGELERRYFENQGGFASFEIQKYMREETCPNCKGKKLKPEVLSITIDQKNISDISGMSIGELLNYYLVNDRFRDNSYEKEISEPVIKEILIRLNFLKNVGLSYLTIARSARTLSGGELQRIRLASQIGTGLTGVLYVLDEPSIGLHSKDVSSLIKTLYELKNLGNTIIIVEHDKETIQSAEHVIELGPRAGKQGGRVMFNGSLQNLLRSRTSLTSHYLTGKKQISMKKKELVTQKGTISLVSASEYNLKKISVNIPLGNMVGITGVSGSGKSTLIVQTLYPALRYYLDGYYTDRIGKFERIGGYQYLDRAYLVDQSPIGRTPRSNPSTYVGFFDEIRELFASTKDARIKGFKKGRFSFNLK